MTINQDEHTTSGTSPPPGVPVIVKMLAEVAAERELQALEALAEREGSARLDLGWPNGAPHARSLSVAVRISEEPARSPMEYEPGQMYELPIASYRYTYHNEFGDSLGLRRDEAVIHISHVKERKVSEDLGLIDARLLALAREIVSEMYVQGYFGEKQRTPAEIEYMAVELAYQWEGGTDDWNKKQQDRCELEAQEADAGPDPDQKHDLGREGY